MIDGMLVPDIYPETGNGGGLGGQEEGGGRPPDSPTPNLAPYLEYRTYTEEYEGELKKLRDEGGEGLT